MEKNIILRGIGGFYDVLTTDNQIVRCKLRGKLRLNNDRILVGDWVEVKLLSETEGVIEAVLPRKNELIRPSIANIDQAVAVVAWSDPKPNWLFLDRLLVLIAAAGLEPIICFNKSDLADAAPQTQEMIQVYRDIGYQVISANTVYDHGIDELRQILTDKVSTFAGPSGVGKSSLLNRIETGLELPVGSISQKLKQGRHTTRQVELLRLSCGGLVADTPGFSQLSLAHIPAAELQRYFPEIWHNAQECRFNGCLHHREPGCAVTMRVKQGEIVPLRYENYLKLLAEIQQRSD